MQWSAGQVRDEQLVRLRKCLDPQRPPRPEDLERDLLALARGRVALMTDFRDHFSLVRHIHGEAGHVPPEVLDAWQEAGPRRVSRELSVVLAALADHGLLDVHGDPAQATVHFMVLISAEIAQRSYWGVIPLSPEETDRITAVGVQTFLRAYGAAR
ncbi:TetR/AcrR family transcriptional regulator C-terminal domain-containing protein [Micromonospora arborensis]|uniref:TetR/AcrR family transcriptional regulator C-terminal domain-containing protein n=1 Tax=Micromonospora arborensis TaxID=2116518 RepID=UPI00341115C5